MNRKKVIAIALCGLALVTAVGGVAWSRTRTVTATDNAYVRTDITSMASKVGGYVISVDVADNQPVKPGDILFRIDDEDYRAKLAQAEANLAAARARLAGATEEITLQDALIRQARAQRGSAAADLDLARKTRDRRQDLIQTNAVSQALVDEAETAWSRASAGAESATATVQAQTQRRALLIAQREGALAAVAQAEAARNLARIDLANTVVRAPVAGRVGNRQVRVGRLVAPGAGLLDIVPVQDVWIVANFKETQLGGIRPGQPVSIRVDGHPNVVFEGLVDSLSPGSGSSFALLPTDSATGNFVRVVQRVPVKIRFKPHPELASVTPGLSARVEIDRGGR